MELGKRKCGKCEANSERNATRWTHTNKVLRLSENDETINKTRRWEKHYTSQNIGTPKAEKISHQWNRWARGLRNDTRNVSKFPENAPAAMSESHLSIKTHSNILWSINLQHCKSGLRSSRQNNNWETESSRNGIESERETQKKWYSWILWLKVNKSVKKIRKCGVNERPRNPQ